MTETARLLLDEIEVSTCHPTAEQLLERLKLHRPGTVLATVYNNLNRLCEEGEIVRLSFAGQPDRYDKRARHDHLLCCRCGGIADAPLPDLTKTLSRAAGEQILSYDLRLSYLCPVCQSESKAK